MVVLLVIVAGSVAQSGPLPGIHTLQVTIGAGVTQVTTSDLPAREIIFQNNAAHVVRVGDAQVSSSRGVQLASGSPGGSLTVGPMTDRTLNLNQFYLAGTNGDVIDVEYVQ